MHTWPVMRKFTNIASQWYFYYHLRTVNKFETESVINWNYCYIMQKLWPRQTCVTCEPGENNNDGQYPTCAVSFEDDGQHSTCAVSFEDDEVNVDSDSMVEETCAVYKNV